MKPNTPPTLFARAIARAHRSGCQHATPLPPMNTPPDLPPGFVRRPVIPIFLGTVALFGGIVWKLLHDLQ